LKYTDKEILLSWKDIDALIKNVCKKISFNLKKDHLENYEIIAITNGGIIPATIISYKMDIKNINLFPMTNKRIIYNKIPFFDTSKFYLLIDEIYDTGKTFHKTSTYLSFINHLDIFLLKRYKTSTSISNHIYGKILDDSRWVVFPWEKLK
jgi:uncharacterized protein